MSARRTTLGAAVLLGLTLLAPAGAASAAGETCRTLTATAVGVPGGTVVGTDGPDVVVTGGATRVETLGGADVVCVTGPVTTTTVTIDTGSDNDIVDVFEADPAQVIDLRLGDGDDYWDNVTAPPPGTRTDGGAGRDGFILRSTDADLRLSMPAGRLTVDGATSYDLAVTSLEDAALTARRVVVDGSTDWNRIELTACRGVARGGAGEDILTAPYSPGFNDLWDCRRSVRLEGGSGTDLMTGAPGPDVLLGGGGNDDLRGGDGNDELRGGSGRDSLNGMAGRDRLLGGGGGDFIRGLAGVDTAVGGPGRDSCRTERRTSCER